MFGNPIENSLLWTKDKFINLCNKIGDGLHGTPKYVEEGDFYFINGNNLNYKQIEIYENTKRISEEEYKKNWKDLTSNTVLLSINGTLGHTSFYKGEKVMLGKSVCYLNLNSKLNKYFILEFFNTDYWKDYMFNNSTGSTISNFGLTTLKNFKMIVPPIELQNEFADFAKLIDKSKLIIEKQIKELQDLFNSKMDQYFG